MERLCLRQLTSHKGLTLVELSVCMGIMALVLGAVLVLQLQGLRMYQQVATTDWANFTSATAVSMLEEDIQGCFRVTGRYEDRITLAMPKMISGGENVGLIPARPLQFGCQIRYYLSDQTGQPTHTGTYLWRAVRPEGASTFVVDPRPLASQITALHFTYTMAPPPRQNSVRKVSLSLEAESREGGTVTTRTHTAEIVLRNATLGPITEETGEDLLEE